MGYASAERRRRRFKKSYEGVLTRSRKSILLRVAFDFKSCQKQCLSELLGTYLLVLVGSTSIILVSLIPNFSQLEDLGLVAFAFAGIVGILVILLGKYSGTIINPALTFAAAFGKLLKGNFIIPYLFSQIIGGLLAGLTLKYLFGHIDASASLGSSKLATGVNPITGIIIEVIGTFVLACSLLIASTKIKSARYQALFVGATLFILVLFMGPLTGASFNPARSLGPALASGYLENLYVYFIGPISGAVLAGILFRVIKDEDASQKDIFSSMLRDRRKNLMARLTFARKKLLGRKLPVLTQFQSPVNQRATKL